MIYRTIRRKNHKNKRYSKKNKKVKKSKRIRYRANGGSNTKIKFFDWWKIDISDKNDKSRPYFESLLNGCINQFDEIHIYSVYNKEESIPIETSNKILRIQYSGEPFYRDPNMFDINCIPGDHPDTNKFITIPLMHNSMYIMKCNMSDFTIPRQYTMKKSNFCLFSVSNSVPQDRIKFFNELTKYKKVDSCGKVMNNLEHNCPGDFTSKEYHDFMSKYKFMICFENTSVKNYVTEKLITAYKNGTIPIYWGCPNIEDYINIESILYLNPGYSEEDLQSLINKIKILDNDDNLYKKKYESIFFKGGKIPDAFNMEILNQEMCKRINSLKRLTTST